MVDADVLARLTGPIAALERSPLQTLGYTYTGATHDRLTVTLRTGAQRRLVVKRVRLAADWTAGRSADEVGREAALLAEPALADVWRVLYCPYVAYACQDGEIALVMEDLTAYLLPDERRPLAEEQEARLTDALAALHARFWESEVLSLPWLTRPPVYWSVLDFASAERAEALDLLPAGLCGQVQQGWAAARAVLPARVIAMLAMPAADLAWMWQGLPRTLVHGDVKVANFALMPDGRVAAFDWAVVGAAPAAVDLGWYIAVNATRLTGSKDEWLASYRRRLTGRRGAALDDRLWDALLNVAVTTGARMLLWSKALAHAADPVAARREWTWWVDRLDAVAAAL